MLAEEDMIKHDKDEGIFHGWHLDKRVSIAHLFATIGFAFGLASWQWAEHERVSLLEQSMLSIAKVDAAEMSHLADGIEAAKDLNGKTILMMNAQYAEILVRLGRIDESINRHLENHGTKR